MRPIIFVIAMFSCCFLFADEWDEQISLYLDMFENSAENTKPVVYPQLAERVENVFLKNTSNHLSIEIVIQGTEGPEELVTELFYGNGELFIIQQREGWNLVTQGDE